MVKAQGLRGGKVLLGGYFRNCLNLQCSGAINSMSWKTLTRSDVLPHERAGKRSYFA